MSFIWLGNANSIGFGVYTYPATISIELYLWSKCLQINIGKDKRTWRN